ncbi:phage gp36-like protein [Elizabethkingia miricola]|uniref:Phage gp36-like protein n=2 Tax=Elizabethkingia miricola TaxID=172045 RepID=A0ABY3NG58_ELIMR|nr:phage gp36-like protein [Elizabethkingia miricola]
MPRGKLNPVNTKIMFIQPEELGTTIYNYQIEQITEGDESIVIQAIQSAESELRAYLVANNKREWKDGRIRYDVGKILAATGADRNPLLVRHCATIAKWYIAELCNADYIYEHCKERYDRAVTWLNKLAKGDITLDTLPALVDPTDPGTEPNETDPFIYGSREKFIHE